MHIKSSNFLHICRKNCTLKGMLSFYVIYNSIFFQLLPHKSWEHLLMERAAEQHTFLFRVLWGVAGWLDTGKFWGQGQAMLAQGWGREKAPLNLPHPCLCPRGRGRGYQWRQAPVMHLHGQQQHNLKQSAFFTNSVRFIITCVGIFTIIMEFSLMVLFFCSCSF